MTTARLSPSTAPPSRTGWVLAGHAFLATSMTLWRAVEGTPGLSSRSGEGILGHPVGEAVLAAWMLAAVGALVASAWLTLIEHEGVSILLGVALALSLSSRQSFDVFDLVYVLVVPLAVAWHVESRRRESATLSS